MLILREIRHELSELTILFLQVPQPPRFARTKCAHFFSQA